EKETKVETAEERRKRIVSIKGDTRSSTGTVSSLTPSVRDASTEELIGPQPSRVWSDVTGLRLEFPVLSTLDRMLLPAPDGVVVAVGKRPRDDGGAAELYRFSTNSPIRTPGAHYE